LKLGGVDQPRGSCRRGRFKLLGTSGDLPAFDEGEDPPGEEEGPGEESGGDFGGQAGAASEGGAKGGEGGLFQLFFLEEFDDPGAEEGAEDGHEEVICAQEEEGDWGEADETADHGPGDGGPGGGFAGAEFSGSDHAADEFEGFGGEEDQEDGQEEGPVGIAAAMIEGEGEGAGEDDPVAGERGDIEGDGGERDQQQEHVEEDIEHESSVSCAGWGAKGFGGHWNF
jgi:hypothetical protein